MAAKTALERPIHATAASRVYILPVASSCSSTASLRTHWPRPNKHRNRGVTRRAKANHSSNGWALRATAIFQTTPAASIVGTSRFGQSIGNTSIVAHIAHGLGASVLTSEEGEASTRSKSCWRLWLPTVR
eukprot:1390936-Amphidinium_carterae.1